MEKAFLKLFLLVTVVTLTVKYKYVKVVPITTNKIVSFVSV